MQTTNARVNAYGIRQSALARSRPAVNARPARPAVNAYSAPDYMLAAKIGAALAVAFVAVAALVIF
jgi:hypothetical protein